MKYAVDKESGKRLYPVRHNEKLYALVDDMVYRVPFDKEWFEKNRAAIFEMRYLRDYINLYTEEENSPLEMVESYEFEELLYDIAIENDQLAETDPVTKQQIEALKCFIVDGRILLENNPLWASKILSDEELEENSKKDKEFDIWFKEAVSQLSGGKYEFVNSSYDMEGEERNQFVGQHVYYVGGGVAEDTTKQATCRGIASKNDKGEFEFVNLARLFDLSSEESSLTENEDGHYPITEEYNFEFYQSEEGERLSVSVKKSGEADKKELILPQRFCGETITDIGTISVQGIESIIVPNSYTGIKGGFRGMESLKKVTLSEQISVIPAECFSCCTSLTETPKTSQMREFGKDAFKGCTSLKKIYFGKKLTKIGEGCFAGCTSLKKVSIPKTIDTIAASLFENCTSLSEVQLPDTVKNIERKAFAGCTSLKKLRLPMSLETIEVSALPEGITLISASYIEEVGKIMDNERYANLQLNYEVEDGSKPKSRAELEQERKAQEEEQIRIANEAAQKELEERQNAMNEVYAQKMDEVESILAEREQNSMVMTSEEEEKYVTPLRNFVKAMPLMGERLSFIVKKGESLDPVKESVVKGLMTTGNIMQTMQLNSQFMLQPVREKFILQLEILRVFADIEVEEPEVVEEVVETMEEPETPEVEEVLEQEEHPVLEVIPEMDEVSVVEESEKQDEIVAFIEKDSKKNFELFTQMESDTGDSFLPVIISRETFLRILPEYENMEVERTELIFAGNAVYFVDGQELVKVDLLSREKKSIPIDMATASRLHLTIEEWEGGNGRFLEESSCVTYLWAQLADLQMAQEVVIEKLTHLLKTFNEQISCMNQDGVISIRLGEKDFSIVEIVEYILEKVKSQIYELVE